MRCHTAQVDECLDRFNEYVRGPLREAVVQDLGGAGDLSWTICVLVYTPSMLLMLVVVWVGLPLRERMGFESDRQYLLANYIECFIALYTNCMTPALQLRIMSFLSTKIQGPSLRCVTALLASMLVNVMMISASPMSLDPFFFFCCAPEAARNNSGLLLLDS